jgi:phosphate transport system substrate-binding protein
MGHPARSGDEIPTRQGAQGAFAIHFQPRGDNHSQTGPDPEKSTQQPNDMRIRSLLAGLAVLSGCVQHPGQFSSASAQMLINGAGATFPYPIYSKWFDEYARIDTSVRFNYQSIGSGGGQKQIMAQTVDFGASDGPMSDDNLSKAPGKILHIPTVAGAVVVTYNLPDDPKLKLDGPTLADIFLGKITRWSDKRIATLNPGVKLPDNDLIVVHRSDGSGTSFIFTDYLSSVSPQWEKDAGRNTSVKWPAGLGAKGNEGVAGQVKQLPGTIGYVELAYAHQNKLPFANVKNAAGNYITASLDSVTEALATAKIPEDFRFSIVNPPGEKAYPISGATWLLVYEQQKDAEKGKKLVEFLNWALTKGESMAAALDYAPLPETVQHRVLERVKTIKY